MGLVNRKTEQKDKAMTATTATEYSTESVLATKAHESCDVEFAGEPNQWGGYDYNGPEGYMVARTATDDQTVTVYALNGTVAELEVWSARFSVGTPAVVVSWAIDSAAVGILGSV